MTGTDDLAATANAHLREAFEALTPAAPGGAVERFGPVSAVATGAPDPMFNRVFAFEDAPGEAVAAAVDWLAGRDVPFWVTATEATAGTFASEPAFERIETAYPGMALSPLADFPRHDAALTVTAVGDADAREAAYDDFVDVVATAFETPRDVLCEYFPAPLVEQDAFAMLVGYHDDEPVASGQLVRTGDVAGVYFVGVVEAARRRGFGEAMTWAVLEEGRDRGCAVGALQSSEMAIPLYEGMGFERVVDYQLFRPAE